MSNSTPPEINFIPVILLFIVFLTSCYCLHLYSNKKFDKTYPVASGYVINKYSNDYACGKQKRYTCTEYFFVLDTLKHSEYLVSSKDFHNISLNSHYTVTKTISEMPWYVSILFLLWFPSGIGCCALVIKYLAEDAYYKDSL